MDTYLAKELQKYYTHRGNRIVFKNALSLNLMALEMWSQLGGQIDASALSRVLKGERLFSSEQLKVFCVILGLSEREEDGLYEALSLDICEKYQVNEEFLHPSTNTMIEYFSASFDKIVSIKSQGLATLAEDWLSDSISVLETKLATSISGELRERLVSLSSKYYLEYIDSILGTKKLDEIPNAFQKPFLSFKKVALAQKSQELMNFCNLELGFETYITHNYKEASILMEQALKFGLDKNKTVDALRCLAITKAYLGQKDEVLAIKKRLLEVLPGTQTYMQSMAIEGLARAAFIMGDLKEGEKTLQLATDKTEQLKNEKDSFYWVRKIQLTRTVIESLVLSKNTSTQSLQFAKKIGDEAMFSAQKSGHLRFKEKIEVLLAQLNAAL